MTKVEMFTIEMDIKLLARLVKFLERVSFSNTRACADTDHEATEMLHALATVRSELNARDEDFSH